MTDAAYKGLIVDWGGVLTSDIQGTMTAWASAENLDVSVFGELMYEWLGKDAEAEAWINPVFALERGEMEVPDFEERLAKGLTEKTGSKVSPIGLLSRMFATFEHAHDMTGLVRRAHTAGIKTALLSNSWGNVYPQHLFDGMFDVTVISGEVGMRKPEERIYKHTLDLMGLPAQACVFVDDFRENILAAADLGLVGVHHKSYDATAAELDVLFGIRLSE